MTALALIESVRATGIELWEENGQLRLKALKGALSDDLRAQLVANKAAIVSLLRQRAAEKVPPILPINRGEFERLPLSFAQERLWFISELEPDSTVYNIPAAVSIRGGLDVERLEQAYNFVIARHDNLRTVFPNENGVPRQRIMERLDFRLERIDVSHLKTRTARREEARRVCRTEAARLFDLARGPLIRGAVIELTGQEHILLLNVHHIISDAWSMGLLIKEVKLAMDAFSAGDSLDLPALPIQYVDYSVWQRKWLKESGLLERQLAYWQKKLAGAPETLDLATDFPRTAVQSFAGATYAFSLDTVLIAHLNSLARQHDSSLFMVLLAVVNVLLYRYSGQEDICIGSPIANRQYHETESLIGMFVNTLVLRSRLEDGDDFVTVLRTVKTACLEAYEHQDAPFEKVVDLVQPARSLAVSPLFQIMVILQNAPMGALGDNIQPYPLDSGISKFELTLAFTEGAEGLAATIEYRTSLYRLETIERMSRHFRSLCQAIVAAPAMNIGCLHYMDETETRQLLVDFNRTDSAYPRDKCIHELFTERVAIDPERTAIIVGDQRLTYGQLHDRSRALALHLQALGVKPDTLVALYAERSLDLVVGILGVLEAGGACLPLDPRSPNERLADVLRDSQSSTVLIQAGLEPGFDSLASSASRLIALGGSWSRSDDGVAASSSGNRALVREVGPHDLAYVIYTSGSTGRPKGVLLTHTTLTNLIFWQSKEIPFLAGERIINFSEPTFDVFMQELFSCLAAGCTLVIPDATTRNDPALLGRFIVENGVHTIFLPYVALTNLLEVLTADHDEVPLKRIITAGEQLAIDDRIRSFFRKYPGVRMHNHYGPSEAHVVTAYALPENVDTWSRFPSIGAPIANTRIYVLGRHDRPQPSGMPGELHIAGDGLARGYLNRPELDRKKFVPDPFRAGGRMYRTGDVARWLSDGNLEYLGRVDTQVKIRGFRVETGEIEVRLSEHPKVEESVVIVQGQGIDKRLVAFYRARGTNEDRPMEPAQEDLRAHLRRTLPEYMLPAVFIALSAIPLTPTGKADRRALAALDVRPTSGRAYRRPDSETQWKLAEIWSEVLNLDADRIGVNDDFFELGGHSLLATQVMFRIRTRLAVDVPLKALFERGSISELAKAIESGTAAPFRAIRWNEPFRLLKVQHENLRGSVPRTMIVPLTHLVTSDVSSSALKRNVETLLEHPIFKLRIRGGGDECLQYYDPDSEKITVDTISVAGGAVTSEQFMSLYDAHTTTIDLRSGPTARCFLVESDTARYIFLLVDHFICDPVTVILLLDLLESCSKGEEDSIRTFVRRPSLSLLQWLEALERRSVDDDVLEFLDYWLDMLEAARASERRMIGAAGRSPDHRQEKVRIPRDIVEAADALVREAKLDSLENIILALFVKSCTSVFREDIVYMTQIYNTRQNPLIDVESSQALGWYSETHPLSLVTPRTGDIVELVKEICRQKMEIAEKRFSFTLLSHYNNETSKRFDACALPGIYFNYQGRGDAPEEQKARSAVFFQVFNVASEVDRIADAERFPYWLSCIARTEDDGSLHVYFIYRSDRLSPGRMKEIVGMFEDAWVALRDALAIFARPRQALSGTA
jgi:amino acid adenylation domain-containing protein